MGPSPAIPAGERRFFRTSLAVLVCASIAGVLLTAAPARATPARVVGLGDLTRYVDDDTSVQLYPGQLGRYSNFVFFDLGGPSGVAPTLGETQLGGLNGGAFLRLGSNFHLGILTSDFQPGEHASFLRQVADNSNPANFDAFDSLVPQRALRRYDLLAAYEVHPSLTAGLRLSYGSRNETFVPDKDDRDVDNKPRKNDVMGQSQFRASIGASGEFQDAGYDFSLDYANYGATYRKSGESAFIGGGGHSIGVNARAKVKLSELWSLVPQIGYQTSFFSLREDRIIPEFGLGDANVLEPFPKPEGEDDSERLHRRTSHLIDAGAAAVLRPGSTVSFWLAVGTRWDLGNEITDIAGDGGLDQLERVSERVHSLPYVKFGFETAVLEWLVLRGGAEKFTWAGSTTFSIDDRTEDGEFTKRQLSGTIDQADFDAYIGASVLLKGFVLDLLIDRGFLRRGPSIISGASGNLAARASLAYRF